MLEIINKNICIFIFINQLCDLLFRIFYLENNLYFKFIFKY